jgi:RNA polymerase sigma-32 factor
MAGGKQRRDPAHPVEDDEPEGLASADDDEREADDELDDETERDDERGTDDEILEPEIIDDDELLGDAAAADDGRPEVLPLPKSSSSSLSRQDPLAAYMRDVQRYNLLTSEEEHELAVRYVEHGDVDAARTLVTSNLRLVVKIAYDYRRAYKNLLDLVQEGNIGLMQAVKKYDPYKGVKLSTYAAWWIRAYILRYILNTHRMVKLGTTQAQRKLFFNLKKEKARLTAMGIDPTPEIIAERLNVTTDEVVQMDRRLSAGDASLDAPVGGDDGRSVARVELLAGKAGPIDDRLAAEQLGDMFTVKIHEFGATLDGKERAIFDERLITDEPKTLQELGDTFGVSRERVRQIEKRLLQKLKAYLRSELGDSVVDVYEA